MNEHSHTDELSPRRTPENWRRLAGLFLLALTLLLSAGDLIHPLLHADADEASHECAFVHWANGELGFAQGTLALAPIDETARPEILPTVVFLFPSAPEFPRHARGPPLV